VDSQWHKIRGILFFSSFGKEQRLCSDPHCFNADPDPILYLNADPDPGPGIQTNADPDSGPRQTLPSQKVGIWHEKYTYVRT
jgi:hypothetical protein